MSEMGDISFCELRTKEVVNSTDGRRMGRIVDLIFSLDTGKIKGVVVPLTRKTLFCKNQDIFIPWKCVQKIGEDVILVNVTMDAAGKMNCAPPKPAPPPRDCCPPPCDCDCDCPPPDCHDDCDRDNHHRCDNNSHSDKNNSCNNNSHGDKNNSCNNNSHKNNRFDFDNRCDNDSYPPRNKRPPPSQNSGGRDSNCKPKDFPNCDRRCEKCMLFDCQYRWVNCD